MFEIPAVDTREASSIFGEVAHLDKHAFDVTLDPGLLVGSLAGGYAARRHYDKRVLEEQARAMRRSEREEQNQLIENDSFAQTQQLMERLKVVFTPINVIYSVNGQTFEIIRLDEMTPVMRKAFQEKDAMFFRDLLLKKMNMELQLVQQAFAQRMLAGSELPKQACFTGIGQALLLETDEGFEKRASEATRVAEGAGALTYRVSLDELRPFSAHAFFFEPEQFEKVANLFDDSVLGLSDIEKKLDVGFLPDRVVYLVNGQMIEQLPLVAMNEDGYRAFRARDKDFFRSFYSKFAQKQEAHLAQERLAQEADGFFDKQAEDVTGLVDDHIDEVLAITPIKSRFRYFEDHEIHPLFYVRLFDKVYPEWRETEIEALVGQIEADYKTQVSQIAFDKIAMLHTASNPEQTLFLSGFTYEKFVRAMNGKALDFTLYQGNTTLGELLFANDMADILTNGENFVGFDDAVVDYTVNEVTDEGVRFIMPLLVSEDPETVDDEVGYYVIVNGLLSRLWRESDDDGDFTDRVLEASLDLLEERAEELDYFDVEGSVARLVKGDDRFVDAVAKHVASTINATEYLEVQRQTLARQLEAFENDWKVTL